MCFGDYIFGVNSASAPFGPSWAPARYTYYAGPLLRSESNCPRPIRKLG
jgi:hypothetical protein